MKKTLSLLVFITLAVHSFAGTIKQEMRMYSRILGDTVKYAVYLPDGYGTNQTSYPVFYLLHGLSDNHLAWIQKGNIKDIAEKAIVKGLAKDMIIVMPDAKDHWYVNSYDGKVRYEDMFFEEFIPFIDATYSTKKEKKYRAVGGLSMGGQGALLYSVKHPEIFSTCCALSAAVYTDEDFTKRVGSFPQLFERIFGKTSPNEHWQKNNVINLMAKMPESQKRAVRFWIDCGDDDFLYRGNAALHTVMRDNKIPHQFRMRDGGHSWTYWQTGMPDILKFISDGF